MGRARDVGAIPSMADLADAVKHLPERTPVPTSFLEGHGAAWQRGASSSGPARAFLVYPGPPAATVGPGATALPARPALVTPHARPTHATARSTLVTVAFSSVDNLLLPLPPSPPRASCAIDSPSAISSAQLGHDASQGTVIGRVGRGGPAARGKTAPAAMTAAASASTSWGSEGAGMITSASIIRSIDRLPMLPFDIQSASPRVLTSQSLSLAPAANSIHIRVRVPRVLPILVPPAPLAFPSVIPRNDPVRHPAIPTILVPALLPAIASILTTRISHSHHHRVATAGSRVGVDATAGVGGGPLRVGGTRGRPRPTMRGILVVLPVVTDAPTPRGAARVSTGKASCRGASGRSGSRPRESSHSAWVVGSAKVAVLAQPRIQPDQGAEKRAPLPSAPSTAIAVRTVRGWVTNAAVSIYGTSSLTDETSGATG